MNFLAHYLLATRLHPAVEPQPAYIVGSALPDLLPLAAPRKRLRLMSLGNAPLSTPEERAITDGARVHLLTDAAFHNTAAFQEAQTQVGELVAQAGFLGIRIRRFFFTHVLVELALDAVLLRRQPQLADAFYNAFAMADLEVMTHWTETTVGQPLPSLSGVLTQFAHSRYLTSYAENDGVAEGLHRLSLRARQDAFTGDNRARLTSLVSDAVALLTARADALLSETVSRAGESYPPATEK